MTAGFIISDQLNARHLAATLKYLLGVYITSDSCTKEMPSVSGEILFDIGTLIDHINAVDPETVSDKSKVESYFPVKIYGS